MLGITHITIGVTATSLLLQTAEPTLLFTGALASLLPDVDTSVSPAGRMFPWASRFLERRMPHRSCTHSLVASLAVALITYPGATWLNIPLGMIHALNIGYFMGWYADSFTRNGVEMFWPDSTRWVVPGNRKYRLATNSSAEYVVLVVLIIFALIVFKINANGGIMQHFNRLLATTNGVQQIYNEKGGNHLVVVHLQGVRASDRTPIVGDYLLIQPRGKNFIVQSQATGEIYQAGTEPDCQILVQRITADPGVGAITSVEPLKLDEEQIASKLEPFNRARSRVFVSGELKIGDTDTLSHLVPDPNQFRSIRAEGNKVILDVAPIRSVLTQLGKEFATGYLSIRSIYE